MGICYDYTMRVNVIRQFILALVMAAFCSTAHAAPSVHEHMLANGLKVLLVEDHKSPLAVFQVWYRVGSMDEGSGKTGVSHVLEHMMFKGTASHPSKELARTVQRFGGMDNAFTSRDSTAYYQFLPAEQLALSVEFESDRMRNLLFAPEDAAAEIAVVMEERRTRTEDDPYGSLYEDLFATTFKVHPYRWPVIGWMEDLKNLTPQDIRAHYDKYYSPDNAFIVVAGDIDPKATIALIEASFGPIKPSSTNARAISPEPQQQGERRVELLREAELPAVAAAYHAPSITHADTYALDVLSTVLSTVLSGGKSSRLYRSLVYEKKLAVSAYADYYSMNRSPSLFILGATATPGTDIATVEQALYDEIEAIAATPPTEREIQKAKNQIASDFIMSQDSLLMRANTVGRFEAAGGWRLMDSYVESIKAVTPQEVQRVARQYFTKQNRTVGTLIPSQGATQK